jgi:hypothetical protein
MKQKIIISMSQTEHELLLKELNDIWEKAYPAWNKMTESEQNEVKRKFEKISELLTSFHLLYGKDYHSNGENKKWKLEQNTVLNKYKP